MAKSQITLTDVGWPVAGDPVPEFVTDLIRSAKKAAAIMSELDDAADKAPGLIVRTDYDLANRNADALEELRELLAKVAVPS